MDLKRPGTESASSWRDEPFRRLVETVSDYAIFLLDPEGRIQSWNRGAQLLKGYEAGEVTGKHFSIFYPEEAVARRWPEHELEAALKIGRFEDEGWRIRKDGSRFWANVVITAMYDDAGNLLGFSKVTRDLTQRRKTEERLRESEERFRALIDGVQDYSIFMLDAAGRVVTWNVGAERMLGHGIEEIAGKSFEVFYPPEDVEAGRPAAELRTATLNRRIEDRGWRVRKDGTRFWADVVVTALKDPTGQPRGFAMVIRDLSDIKRIEELEQQGRHLTEFLAMLSHELRNPLAPIRNALAIMAMAGEANPQVNWCRDVIERQVVHLTRLVDDLLDVSRITRGKLRLQMRPMDLRDAMASAVEATRPLFAVHRQKLHEPHFNRPIRVNGDITRLTQVIVNLLNNAAKYTPENGQAWIEAETEGEDAIVRVRDNGSGIPSDMLEGVFDLFAQGERTIDRAEGGLGIGLTLVRRIVALHGGSVVARSEGPGRGSEFEVRLPLLGERAP